MANKRLLWHLESTKILTPHQSGFRPRRSTQDHITTISDTISKSISQGKQTTAVFLDITKAYDLVWTTGLLMKLEQLNITGPMYNFISKFIHNRQCSVSFSKTLSNPFNPDFGLPQGSVISPTLFLIMINDIPIESQQSIFADDIAIWHSSNSPKASSKILQKSLNSIHSWSLEWGFNFSHEKTRAISFSRKNPKDINLKLGGLPIDSAPHVKFLGILLDRKFKLNLHVKETASKCQRIVNLMRCVRGNSWGADQKSLLTIFKSHIMAYLTYSAPVFMLLSKTQLKKLESVYNRGLKTICNVGKNANPAATQVLTGCPPAELVIKQAYLKYSIRAETFDLPSASANITTWHSIFNKRKTPLLQKTAADFHKKQGLPISKQPTSSRMPPWQPMETHIDTSLANQTMRDNPALNKATTLEHIQTHYADLTTAYTDGSKQESAVGYGVFIPSLDIRMSVRIKDHADIFTAEAQAILAAILALKDHNTARCIILSDSLSVLTALLYNSPSPILDNIRDALLSAQASNCQISLLWIPAHCGIQGNETADHLAKQALKETHQEDVPLSLNIHYSRIRTYILEQWQKSWTNNNHPMSYAIDSVTLKAKSFHSNPRLNYLAYRLALNIPPLNKYLSRFTPVRPACPNCTLSLCEDRNHFLFTCPAYKVQRNQLITELSQNNLKLNWRSVLSPEGCHAFCKYIHATGRFNKTT